MIEKITEKNVWDTIKDSRLPIVLFGMGNGADMVIETLKDYSLKPDAIFASDEFVRGHSFRGYKVKKYSEIKEEFDNFIIVMCFAVHDFPTLENVRQMSLEHTLVAPNVPIVDDGNFTREYIAEHDGEFDKAYALLDDDFSRKSFVDVLNFKVSGKVSYLFGCQKEKPEIYHEYLKIQNDEVFMDLGAYDGDTVREFLQQCKGEYKKIIAVEADEKNFKKLEANTFEISNIDIHNLAAWDKKETLFFDRKKGRNSKLSSLGKYSVNADSVDNILGGGKITVLKMDIEGSELKALEGARNTIKHYAPKLYICAYHRNSDMFELPLKIKSLNEKYKIHFCHHPYIPAWESNFYCNID